MEYWTVLWITVLGGPLDGTGSGLLYQSMQECDAARAVISDTLPYDHSLECIETAVISASIRPMPRPEVLP